MHRFNFGLNDHCGICMSSDFIGKYLSFPPLFCKDKMKFVSLFFLSLGHLPHMKIVLTLANFPFTFRNVIKNSS